MKSVLLLLMLILSICVFADNSDQEMKSTTKSTDVVMQTVQKLFDDKANYSSFTKYDGSELFNVPNPRGADV